MFSYSVKLGTVPHGTLRSKRDITVGMKFWITIPRRPSDPAVAIFRWPKLTNEYIRVLADRVDGHLLFLARM